MGKYTKKISTFGRCQKVKTNGLGEGLDVGDDGEVSRVRFWVTKLEEGLASIGDKALEENQVRKILIYLKSC